MDWNKDYLYHYTSFEAAVKIVSSRKLLFSEIHNLNDINESCGPTILYHGFLQEEILEFETKISKYIQLSLSEDKCNRKGFDIPAMWGHYASKGHGVCLVLDKERFVASLDGLVLYHRDITYTPINDMNEISYYNNRGITFDEFIHSTKDELFFHKSNDWAYEQEYRVIDIIDKRQSLSVKDSLIGVILYNRNHESFLNSIEYISLSKLAPDLKFYRYVSRADQSYDLHDEGNLSVKPAMNYDLSITSELLE